ncbi:MAG: hypothetical protein JXJ20_06745 [Anaerolineae bacterium]|nr:hypothetical protein [Anaerolineae bacterium]
MSARTIQVHIDDRVRLMSAVLSVTNWPEMEQRQRRYRAHVHARMTARGVMPLANHPAVHTLQTLLDQGTPLEAIYTYALSLSWPDLLLEVSLPWAPLHWDEQLGDFFVQAGLEEWWYEEEGVWARAYEQTAKIVTHIDLYRFFEPFVGGITEQLVLMPNISYPSDSAVGIRLPQELCCIVPPRIALGDNEPWPFDEDAAHVFRAALSQYGRLLMVSYLRQHAATIASVTDMPLLISRKFNQTHPTWSDQFTELFVAGTVALFMEQAISPQEARAYILMENKVHGVKILPSVVRVLKRYLAEYEEGRYKRFADYLPNFPKHLRVARSIVSL